MESNKVEEILRQASAAVASLPESLQGKAFELAVSMLTGEIAQQPTPSPGKPPRASDVSRQAAANASEGELPDVSDLLRVCKRNPDRYLIFLRDAEVAEEQIDTSAVTERFRKYKQDTPKLPTRDLSEMVAKGLIEQIGKGRDATFALKRKGRERLAQLDASASAE